MGKISKNTIGAYSSILILQILQKQDSYGYEIMTILKKISEGKLVFQMGSLYPILKKLESKKYIKSYWGGFADGTTQRPRRYYKILAKGKIHLIDLLEELKFVHKMIEVIEK